jgi:hypothetical protein
VVAVGDTVYTLSGGPTPGLHVSAATEALDLGEPCPEVSAATSGHAPRRAGSG